MKTKLIIVVLLLTIKNLDAQNKINNNQFVGAAHLGVNSPFGNYGVSLGYFFKNRYVVSAGLGKNSINKKYGILMEAYRKPNLIGSSFGLGYSYALKNKDTINLGSTTSPYKVMAKSVPLIQLHYKQTFKIYKFIKGYFSTGYALPLTNKYTVISGSVPNNKLRDVYNFTSPGGFNLGMGIIYSIGSFW